MLERHFLHATAASILRICCVPSFSTFSVAIKASLAFILAGIGMASVTDVHFRIMGLVYGLLGVLGTSLYQVQVKHVMKEKEFSGLQLSHNTAFPKACVLALLVPFVEARPWELASYSYTKEVGVLAASLFMFRGREFLQRVTLSLYVFVCSH